MTSSGNFYPASPNHEPSAEVVSGLGGEAVAAAMGGETNPEAQEKERLRNDIEADLAVLAEAVGEDEFGDGRSIAIEATYGQGIGDRMEHTLSATVRAEAAKEGTVNRVELTLPVTDFWTGTIAPPEGTPPEHTVGVDIDWDNRVIATFSSEMRWSHVDTPWADQQVKVPKKELDVAELEILRDSMRGYMTRWSAENQPE